MRSSIVLWLERQLGNENLGWGRQTSKCGGTGEATADIHGGDGVPDPVLVRSVIQTLHRAEPGPSVVASDHVHSIMERHGGDVTSFPCNVLLKEREKKNPKGPKNVQRDKKKRKRTKENDTYRKKSPLLRFWIIFLNYIYWRLLAAKPTDNQKNFFGTWRDQKSEHAKQFTFSVFLPKIYIYIVYRMLLETTVCNFLKVGAKGQIFFGNCPLWHHKVHHPKNKVYLQWCHLA